MENCHKNILDKDKKRWDVENYVDNVENLLKKQKIERNEYMCVKNVAKCRSRDTGTKKTAALCRDCNKK